MHIAINLIGLIIGCGAAFFLGRKFKRLILKENEFIGVICSIGILTTFFMTKDVFLSSDKSFLAAVSFGVTYGLAFGIGNRGRQKNN